MMKIFAARLAHQPYYLARVAVDRHTLVRYPRPSASWLGSVARARALSGVAQSV